MRKSHLLKLMNKNQHEIFFFWHPAWWQLQSMAKLPLNASWISFHWSEPMWGFAFTPSNSPSSFLLFPLPHILVPVQTFQLSWSLPLPLGNYDTLLEKVEKRRKLRFSDTESLGFGRSIIFQAQQDHIMSMCLREALAQVGKKEERIRKGRGEERERGEDRKTCLMWTFMHSSILQMLVAY